ncbi:MAG: hypothetical protein HOP28_07400, partial [Gemmatimonadales bacterium]|nr:hypothetical protein [Gemmatimonadales bacterium]
MHVLRLLLAVSGAGLVAAAPTLTGTWKASLALAGKSTYIGTVEFAAPRDTLISGQLALSSPVSVVAPLRGVVRGDSVRLTGDYQAGNGCTGSLSGTLHVADSAGVVLAKG